MICKWVRYILPVIACLLFIGQSAYAGSSDIMLEGFDWGSGSGWWTTLQNDVPTISASGFTMVWLPPATKTADSHGYLPTQWYDLNDSPYGNQSALVGAINALHGKQIKAIADIVINHRCGNATAGADFTNPVFGEGQGSSDYTNPNNARAVCDTDECGCGTGAPDTGVNYNVARDLDHTWSTTQSTIEAWMNWMKGSIGFDGWRYDMCTGYGGQYVGIYNGATSPYFSVGEYWDTSTTNENNWVDLSGSAAFDFATKSTLDAVFNNNNYSYLSNNGAAPGLLGVNPSKAVTFVDDHDTAASGGENMLPMPSQGIQQAYVYVLTHPGTPCVFWDQYWSNQSLINRLISIRKQQGITSTSSLSIQACNSGLYAAIVNGNTAVKIGPNSWSPSGNWTLATSGNNYAVWTAGGGGGGTVATTFIIQNCNTTYGQNVYVVGNISQLGSWTPANGFALTIQGSGANVPWKGTINLPANTTFQYKYVKWDGSTAVWESGNNRQQTTPASGSVTYNDGNF